MAIDCTFVADSTAKIIEVFIRDNNTGSGKTGLAHSSVSASSVRTGGARAAVTLASGAAGDAYSSGKWAEVDSTNMPGFYQFHIPNALLAAGAASVSLLFSATGTIPKPVRITLTTSGDFAPAVTAIIADPYIGVGRVVR